MRRLSLLLIAAGCGSSWDLRKGAEGPPLECETLLNYYKDVDGDGWGDPFDEDGEPSEPQPRCRPDEGNDFTATNAMDCDDLDPDVGPDSGGCPEEVGSDEYGPVDRVGLVRGDSEYLFFIPTGDVTQRGAAEEKGSEAEGQCIHWTGRATEGSPEGDRGLAVLTDRAEVAEVLNKLDEALVEAGITESCEELGSACPAFFVGMRWEGEISEDCDDPFDGGWVWDDGQGPTGDIPFCNNVAPTPQDFQIGRRLCAVVADGTAAAEAASLRMALVREDQGWCLGTAPYVAGETDSGGMGIGNHPDQAWFTCERPVLDPADYVDVPDEGAVEVNDDE